MNIKKILGGGAAGVLMLGSSIVPAFADTYTQNFDGLDLETINAQDGWSSLGNIGSGCALYDHEVDDALGTDGFGSQSLRISNAVTSGCFGDQTFSKPLTDAVGEADATAGGFTEGTRQTHFEMEFDVASAVPEAQQPGLFMSVSPDRGDGSRMSYVGFEDVADGIDMIFYDVQGTDTSANFVLTDLGTYTRTPHTVKLVMDVVDGPSNDVVNVYVDDVLKHTGTSWENYFRFDTEASAEQSPRIVKNVLFRTGGVAAPATAGNGFLVDNLSLASSIPDTTAPDVPVHQLPVDNGVVTTHDFTFDWTSVTDSSLPVTYAWEASLLSAINPDGSFVSPLASHTGLTDSSVYSPGTPDNVYYWHVRAVDNASNSSAWTNAWRVTVNTQPVLVGPPTNKDQCKNDGWKLFNNPTFRNQGQCVSYVVSNVNAGKKN